MMATNKKPISNGQDQQQDLALKPLLPLMLRMSLPGMIAQIINILYSIVDRIYIGHIPGVGADALTGVGLTLPLITFISAFAMIIGSGGAPRASIALGQGKQEEAERILGNGAALLLCFAFALMLFFYCFKIPLLRTFGASEDTLLYANNYFRIYLFGTFSVLLYMGLNPFVIAQGKALIAMCSVGIGAILNLILDPIFIFLFHLGVNGAAIATVISQTASALWVLTTLLSPKASLPLCPDKIRLRKKQSLAIVSLGISPFIMTSTESMIALVINSGLARYGGDLYVGSFTIIQSVSQLFYAPLDGFRQGIQPIISYNYGAGNKKRVKATYRSLISICFSVRFFSMSLAMLFPQSFASLFTDNQALIRLVGQVMPVFLIGMLFFGIQEGIQPTFVALGQAKVSLFIAIFRKIILLIPLALMLPHLFGVMGVYYAEPISDLLSVAVCSFLFLTNIHRIIETAPEHA